MRDIVPSKAVKNFMKLQIVADGQKQVSILRSKGKRDSDINSAQQEAKAIVLEAEATAQALAIISQKKISTYPNVYKVLQFVLVKNYLDMGVIIGNIESNKAMFIDHRHIFLY